MSTDLFNSRSFFLRYYYVIRSTAQATIANVYFRGNHHTLKIRDCKSRRITQYPTDY